jgi:hypothetical protein
LPQERGVEGVEPKGLGSVRVDYGAVVELEGSDLIPTLVDHGRHVEELGVLVSQDAGVDFPMLVPVDGQVANCRVCS